MKKNIMFVDNSASELETMKSLFKDEPYTIFTFNDPFRALGAINVTEFAVVAVDQLIQEIDSLEFIKRVKDKSPDTATIMVYAFVEPEKTKEVMRQEDVYIFVKKPIDNNKIKQAVELALVDYQINIETKRLLNLVQANHKERQWQ